MKPVRLPELIHHPELQSRLRRGVFAIIATLGWMLWLYLFAPLLSIAAWLFGFHRFQHYAWHNTHRAVMTLLLYLVIIAAAGATFVLWAVYNLLRFGRRDRRMAITPVTLAEMALAYGVTDAVVGQMRAAKVQRVHHDEHGNILRIEPLDTQ